VRVVPLPVAKFDQSGGPVSVEPGTQILIVLTLPLLRPDQFRVRVEEAATGIIIDHADCNVIGYGTLKCFFSLSQSICQFIFA